MEQSPFQTERCLHDGRLSWPVTEMTATLRPDTRWASPGRCVGNLQGGPAPHGCLGLPSATPQPLETQGPKASQASGLPGRREGVSGLLRRVPCRVRLPLSPSHHPARPTPAIAALEFALRPEPGAPLPPPAARGFSTDK